MQRHFRKTAWLAVTCLVALSLTLGAVLAHEGRPVGDYRFVVGWLEEPAYESMKNAVSVRITKVMESESQEGSHEDSGEHHDEGAEDQSGASHEENDEEDGRPEEPSGHDDGTDNDEDDEGEGHDEDEDSDRSPVTPGAAKPLDSVVGQHSGETVPVEGFEETLQVEVTHVASGASRVLNFYAVRGDPGHYTADLIPTAAGVYEFRVFGSIEGTAVDETFVSRGAGGGFDDIQTSAELQFPVPLPELREIENGVRGALQTAQQAQDAALAASENGSGNVLAVVALIVGIVGVIFGAAGIFMGLRGRQS